MKADELLSSDQRRVFAPNLLNSCRILVQLLLRDPSSRLAFSAIVSFLGGLAMPRKVRCALIQASNALSTERPLSQIRKAMIDKHLKLIDQAVRKKTQILCLQELFYGPYFCAEQNARW